MPEFFSDIKVILMRIVIDREIIESCLQGARESYPTEFIGLMSGKIEKNDVIVDGLYLAPLASVDGRSASFNPYHLPAGLRLVGSFHSHPSGPAMPSDADLSMFSRTGAAHIIAARPYTLRDVSAFDRNGKKIELVLVGIDSGLQQ